MNNTSIVNAKLRLWVSIWWIGCFVITLWSSFIRLAFSIL